MLTLGTKIFHYILLWVMDVSSRKVKSWAGLLHSPSNYQRNGLCGDRLWHLMLFFFTTYCCCSTDDSVHLLIKNYILCAQASPFLEKVLVNCCLQLLSTNILMFSFFKSKRRLKIMHFSPITEQLNCTLTTNHNYICKTSIFGYENAWTYYGTVISFFYFTVSWNKRHCHIPQTMYDVWPKIIFKA